MMPIFTLETVGDLISAARVDIARSALGGQYDPLWMFKSQRRPNGALLHFMYVVSLIQGPSKDLKSILYSFEQKHVSVSDMSRLEAPTSWPNLLV